MRQTPVAPVLAVLWLCAWDWHRFRPMITLAPLEVDVPSARLDRWESAGFTVFAITLIEFFGFTRSFIGPELVPALIATGCGAGLFTLGRFLWVRRRSGRRANPS